MSRCFPFPPPGYEAYRDPSLRESIKLLKEQERKAKKEKRKEKKNRKKEKSKNREHKHKDTKKDETILLERSGLTEEHAPPLCDSSDSTQNNGKRKIEITTSPESILDQKNGKRKREMLQSKLIPDRNDVKRWCEASVSTTPDPVFNHGTAFRIRLPSFSKHNEPQLPQPPMPATTVETLVRKHDHNSVLQKVRESPPMIKTPSLSHTDTKSISSETITPKTTREEGTKSHRHLSRLKKMQKMEAKYNALVTNWKPPTICLEFQESEDLHWLNECKKKRESIGDSMVPTVWSDSIFLDGSLYALPYAVPY